MASLSAMAVLNEVRRRTDLAKSPGHSVHRNPAVHDMGVPNRDSSRQPFHGTKNSVSHATNYMSR